MLSSRDYRSLCADSGICMVAEMDTDYNVRTEQIAKANPTTDVYSIAKVFTATAIGMCVDRGLLSVEDAFLDVMELPLPEGADEKWKKVTIHMLLRHRFGIATRGFLDIDANDVSTYPTKDYLAMVLAQPLPEAQNGERVYTDAAYYLLSRVVEKVTGQTLFDFLRPTLMGTMDFAEYAWSACPFGHTIGASGLFVRCADVVKLGVLYLNGGVWKGTRVVSKTWCDTVLAQEYDMYDNKNGWHHKGGMFGQMLAIHPESGLAVAWTGHGQGKKLEQILCADEN